MESKVKPRSKEDVIKKVIEKTGFTKYDANLSINAVLSAIEDILSEGESISFLGFGKFKVTTRSARQGINPKTGVPMHIPESNSVSFSAGAKLKAAVNPKK